jgi:intein-encoded DNA endonuclease-like protein
VLSISQKQKIIELYKNGMGSDTIAKQFNVNPGSILKILKSNNIEICSKIRKIPLDNNIIQWYKNGMSLTKIANLLNVSHVTILKYLKFNNIERRSANDCHRIYEINELLFDNVNNESIVYFLGFLFADGCNMLKNNFVKLEIAQQDEDTKISFLSLC